MNDYRDTSLPYNDSANALRELNERDEAYFGVAVRMPVKPREVTPSTNDYVATCDGQVKYNTPSAQGMRNLLSYHRNLDGFKVYAPGNVERDLHKFLAGEPQTEWEQIKALDHKCECGEPYSKHRESVDELGYRRMRCDVYPSTCGDYIPRTVGPVQVVSYAHVALPF